MFPQQKMDEFLELSWAKAPNVLFFSTPKSWVCSSGQVTQLTCKICTQANNHRPYSRGEDLSIWVYICFFLVNITVCGMFQKHAPYCSAKVTTTTLLRFIDRSVLKSGCSLFKKLWGTNRWCDGSGEASSNQKCNKPKQFNNLTNNVIKCPEWYFNNIWWCLL